MAVHFKQVVIIGVGLIGGSLGMVIRRKALADKVIGVGRRVENLKAAVALGAIDRYVADPQEAVRGADLVVLATPVDTYERHLQEWAHCLSIGAIVSDVGSVKGTLVERSESVMPSGVHFVGAHPIAGKENRGRSRVRSIVQRCALYSDAHETIRFHCPGSSETVVARDWLNRLDDGSACARPNSWSGQSLAACGGICAHECFSGPS